MRRTFKPKLKEQEVVPYFQLPSNCETMVSSWDYKQKSNLVMFFFHSIVCEECRQFLTQLAGRYEQFKEMNAQVLAITIASVDGVKRLAEALSLPFPVLADDTGKVSEQFTHIDPPTRTPVPGVFVADRFGALYSQSIAEQESALPALDEITDWLNLIELQCPECGISEWVMPDEG